MFLRIFLSAEGSAVVLRKVAEGLCFNFGQYGSFAVFAFVAAFTNQVMNVDAKKYIFAVFCGSLQFYNNCGLNRVSVKGGITH